MMGECGAVQDADVRQLFEEQAIVSAEILLPEPFILLIATEQRLGRLLAALGWAAYHAGHVAKPRTKRVNARGVDMCCNIRPAEEAAAHRRRRVPDEDQVSARFRYHAQLVGFRLLLSCEKCFPTGK